MRKVSFWRIFFASLLATIVVSVLGWIVTFSILGGLFEEEVDSSDLSVLHLKLEGVIKENGTIKLDPVNFGIDKSIGLSEILTGLQSAEKDKNVKGLLLDLKSVNCGYSTAKEIRKAIEHFKATGKFVYAYLDGESVSQKQYYISSVADKIYGFETSIFEFFGLGAEYMYYKKGLDKLGVEVQVIRGSNNDFKSAVEPYFRTEMSDSSRVQTQRYLDLMWNEIIADISKSRSISKATLNDYASKALIQRLSDGKRLGLIDGICYRDELVGKLKEKLGKSIDLSNLRSFEKYAKDKFTNRAMMAIQPKVAVVLAQGGIAVSGDEMNSLEVCKQFREIRKNKDIKVVVFRVNSPGGSALASEEIWREVSLTAKNKKVIVSMGDVAASGGYYVATAAHKIYAESTTITGSIGVFGMIPYTGKMLEDYVGLSFDRVQTNEHAVLSLNKKLTPVELQKIQEEVDNTYSKFKLRVSEGRGLSLKQVERIARGRVWIGKDAINIGLVDKLGGLSDALNEALLLAGKNSEIEYFPKNETSGLTTLLEQLDEQSKLKLTQSKIQLPKGILEGLTLWNTIEKQKGIQMRLNLVPEIH